MHSGSMPAATISLPAVRGGPDTHPHKLGHWEESVAVLQADVAAAHQLNHDLVLQLLSTHSIMFDLYVTWFALSDHVQVVLSVIDCLKSLNM